MTTRRINCDCGVKHWSTCRSEVKIKCRCGKLLAIKAIEDSNASNGGAIWTTPFRTKT